MLRCSLQLGALLVQRQVYAGWKGNVGMLRFSLQLGALLVQHFATHPKR